MDITIFLEVLNELLESAKAKNTDIANVEIVADSYYNCLQFADKNGNLLAEIDFTDDKVLSFYGALK